MKAGALAVLALVVISLVAEATPLEPVEPRFDLVLPPYGRLVESRPFAAKDRANVIASGKGLSNFGLYVYDGQGNCVAWDDLGSASTRDDVAVDWFPQQKEPFTYELRNLGARSNRFGIAVR